MPRRWNASFTTLTAPWGPRNAAHLDWLKEEHGDPAARILSNARCLSEGVDVPALDAILFMHPRKSQIDVVQSVGRVMRRAPGKQMGYVILPIGVPAGMTPEDALNDNERYRVVWQILNALRSHDERFDAQLNQADLGVDISGKIEVIAVSNKLPVRKDAAKPRPISARAARLVMMMIHRAAATASPRASLPERLCLR